MIMKQTFIYSINFILILLMSSCNRKNAMDVKIYETSENGNKINIIQVRKPNAIDATIEINPEKKYQKIEGFGGAFTEASASLLQQLSEKNRQKIIKAYFGKEGAEYSLTRTHMNSCDFSLSNYAYDMEADDMQLEHFSIKEDMDDLIPMIKAAQKASEEGFKIISSPWTAPPWMKDNKDWKGGKLLEKYYDTWALYFSKYMDAYQEQGIDIWGITVENEPLGNGNNWESMIFSPEEMNNFVQNHLGPQLKKTHPGTKILGYDQNRGDEMLHWADVMYDKKTGSEYFDGMAIHWYASTYDVFPKSLDYVHQKAPNKLLIQTEACIDAEVPHWKDDVWYWKKEATDWGYDWAPEDQKYLHPKYAPVFRYAQDIIGCMNHQVNGWVDWNMVLDKQGGPNWAKNWCIAPVIVDPKADEVYFTPLYYIMAQFSKFVRPGAQRIGFEISNQELQMTAFENPDQSIAIILFNPTETSKGLSIKLNEVETSIEIGAKTLQTIILKN